MLDFKNFNFLMVETVKKVNCINMQNVVEIGWTAADIWFFNFSRWRPPPFWIFGIWVLMAHITYPLVWQLKHVVSSIHQLILTKKLGVHIHMWTRNGCGPRTWKSGGSTDPMAPRSLYVGTGRRLMHDGMQYDPIQGQGHEPLKVGNSTIFKGYLLPHL